MKALVISFIFTVIFPLLFIISLGYLCGYKVFLTKAQITGISRFTFSLSMPVFLFLNMYQADLKASFDMKSVIAFYVPVVSVYMIGFGLWRLMLYRLPQQALRGQVKEGLPCQDNVVDSTRLTPFPFLRKPSMAASGVYALACSYSNTVLVGLPIIIATLGETMIGRVFTIMTFHSALLFGLTYFCEANSGANAQQGSMSWSGFLKSVLLNNIVLSIGLGLLVNLSGFQLWSFLFTALDLLAKPALTCALFVLGANLCRYQIRQGWVAAFWASMVKLLLLPSLVYVFGNEILHMDATSLNLVVLLSASPLGVNAYLIAAQLKQQQDIVASSVVLSTILSLLSFSLWLFVLL
ncbi:AEC family transporter [uncultured Shewanella sp.]|uniref:AEC family transporter n=1 Tax=uncultured Shewanella sp. TaxID=173975 RepID=UPI00262EA9C9|nr:AEC family transporter [uncultured Shewanella sp.]